jgi:hypothetical protein
MPYGRCVVYSLKGADERETVEKSRIGILPIFKQQPGFVAYGVVVKDGKIFSMSAWNSEDEAQAANEAAREWVTENLDVEVVASVIGDFAWLEFATQ